MNIEKKINGTTLTVVPEGHIDTLTSPELEKSIDVADVSDLVFDFAKVDYISSAGLRVLVRASKRLGRDHVIVENATQVVREVFDVVGFSDALTFRS